MVYFPGRLSKCVIAGGRECMPPLSAAICKSVLPDTMNFECGAHTHGASTVWFYFCSLLYLVSNAAFLWFKPDYRTPLYLAGTAIFFFAR